MWKYVLVFDSIHFHKFHLFTLVVNIRYDMIKQLRKIRNTTRCLIHIFGDFNVWHESWNSHMYNKRDIILYNAFKKIKHIGFTTT